MKILYLLTVAVVIFAGCANDPMKVESSNNPQVAVSLLFEHDGCKVYRFRDSGHWIYYSKCTHSSQDFME